MADHEQASAEQSSKEPVSAAASSTDPQPLPPSIDTSLDTDPNQIYILADEFKQLGARLKILAERERAMSGAGNLVELHQLRDELQKELHRLPEWRRVARHATTNPKTRRLLIRPIADTEARIQAQVRRINNQINELTWITPIFGRPPGDPASN